MIRAYWVVLLLCVQSSLAFAKGDSGGGGKGVMLDVNIPHVYNISYESLNRASGWTYSFGAGYLPPITISTASVSVMSFESHIRWHPFGGAFLLGLIGGYHKYSGSGTTTLNIAAQNVPITVTDDLSGMYITPHLGWLWFFGNLLVGLEAGTQTGIGTSNSIGFTINDPTMTGLQSQVEASSLYTTFKDGISNSVSTLTSLPYVAFRLGWKL